MGLASEYRYLEELRSKRESLRLRVDIRPGDREHTYERLALRTFDASSSRVNVCILLTPK